MTTQDSEHHLVYVITEDWFFASHFLDRAKAAIKTGHRVSVVTRCRETASGLAGSGLEFENFEFSRRGLNPFSEIGTVIRLASLLRKIKPNVVHNIALKPVTLGTLAARVAGIQNIVNAPVGMGYVFTSQENKAKILRPVVRRVIKYVLGRPNSRIVIENNEDLQNLIRQEFAEPEQIFLIKGAGVDTRKFSMTPEPTEPIKVIMVSRLLRDKGVFEFIEAAKIVSSSNSTVQFILVGDVDDGNPTSLTQEEIRELSLSGIVKFLGTRSDVAQLLAASHIACLPSYREGLPKSLIEAAAAGRPIVTTDVTGCREVVTDQVNGLLVPPRDSAALAEALLILINDPEMRKTMGARNRQKAEQEFANEIIIGQTLEIYKSFYSS